MEREREREKGGGGFQRGEGFQIVACHLISNGPYEAL